MISFESVSYVHPSGVKALEDVNLRIELGEIVAVVGTNGAGKTTLVKHVNGLLKPTSGSVLVFGEDTRKQSVASLSRRIGIVFQNANHQIFSDTVRNEIAFALRNFGFEDSVVEKRIEWALQFFNLERYSNTSPLLLSGGEKKRLCLAVVLAWDPDIVILDEPTVGQDMIHKEKIHQIVTALRHRGKSVIIVSHDVEFLWPLQPRIVVMSKGRILQDGSAHAIFEQEEVMSEASLLPPQLVEFSKKLKRRPERPFPTIFDAKGWILDKRKT